jgi:hypothetical protein
MNTKVCPICKLEKPCSEFSPRTAQCKPCKKAYARKWYAEHREYAVQYARDYVKEHHEEILGRLRISRKTEPGRAANRRYQHSAHAKEYVERNRDAINKSKRAWAERNRDKKQAGWHVWKAVKDGILIRPNECQNCGKDCKPHAHHYMGYAPEHRLDVLWLCTSCHEIDHHGPPVIPTGV